MNRIARIACAVALAASTRALAADAPQAAPASSPAGSGAAPAATKPDEKLVTGLYLVHLDDADGRVRASLADQKIYIEPKPSLERSAIASATVERGPAPKPGAQPQSGLRLTMTKEGTTALAALSTKNIGLRLAIVVDGDVVAVPMIEEPITSGIVVVSGNFDPERAKQLAAALSPEKSGR